MTFLLAVFFLTIFISSCEPAALKSEPEKCGYDSCPPLKDGFINVHLVAHTHDDVGWLKTVDQYYYGANNTIQNAGVQYILDSVIDELKKDPTRRFIYVETAFFWQWWQKQKDYVKHQVKALVANGQLEFIGGAWSMNDEAASHYHSIIDDFTWGLRKLNDTFGTCGRPKIGWQIDPFGHSREMASIFSELGFDANFLGRVDYEDKAKRFAEKTAEMIWQGNGNFEADLFTSVLYNNYAPPKGFCFDILCEDEPLIDDNSPLNNIDRKIDDFFAFLDNMTNVYTTPNLLVTMGEDFNFQDANPWFKNLDKLIYHANKRQTNGGKYNLIYSTPSCYVKGVYDAHPQLPTKSDDFFPYASDPNAFWTGYFTSRPTLKRFERQGNNFLQVCKQLYALKDLDPQDWVDLNALREAMGVMQHHDAVTGTEKQHVADDYARILQNGIDECQVIVNTALNKIITGDDGSSLKFPLEACWLTNTSSCRFTETKDQFLVTIYNPLSRPVTKLVRLPVTGTAYQVTDPQNLTLPVQLTPISKHILRIPGRNSSATVELIFEAKNISALGFKTFEVKKINGNQVNKAQKMFDEQISVNIDDKTGFMSSVTLNGVTVDVSQEFLYYEGAIGDNREFKNRSSGAYILRPIPGKEPVVVSTKADVTYYQGEIVQEAQQVFNEWISQTIRVYPGQNLVEFDWVVGPIPNKDVNGKEIITRFTSSLQTKSSFYTDSNGRQMIQRVRNSRPTWSPKLDEPIAGNYYPITTKVTLKDDSQNLQLSILTDRAQGCSSLKDGEIEIMVHRNCLHDDAFGVGEALNETAFGEPLVARGSLYLVVGPQKSASGSLSTTAKERDIAQRKILDSWVFVSDVYPSGNNYLREYSGLTRSLPANVQILTLEPWKGFSFLLRLEHVLEKDEDEEWSKPAMVNLTDLFTPFDIANIQETTLGANQWLNQNEKLDFVRKTNKRATLIEVLDNYQITLNPMQIRTFVIEIVKHSR